MTKRFCNKCGKEIDNCYDGAHVEHKFGYGSMKDGLNFELDLCNECLDEVADKIVEMCKHSPIDGF